jgi:hypothetical protein
MYNGKVTFGEVKDIKISSKYAEYQISRAGNCAMPSLYNDKVNIENATAVNISESKYTSFNIGQIGLSLEDRDGYNDSFDIRGTGKEITGLAINGKYLDISLVLAKSINCRFKADISYADISIDESTFRPKVKVIEGNTSRYDAVQGTESEKMPVVDIKGYEVKVKITDR